MCSASLLNPTVICYCFMLQTKDLILVDSTAECGNVHPKINA